MSESELRSAVAEFLESGGQITRCKPQAKPKYRPQRAVAIRNRRVTFRGTRPSGIVGSTIPLVARWAGSYNGVKYKCD